MSRSLTWWQAKRSRHYSRRMCNPQFYVSDRSPIIVENGHHLRDETEQCAEQALNVKSDAWMTLLLPYTHFIRIDSMRVFGSTTLVTRVSLTDMRNINNPASCCCPTKAICFIRDTLLFVRAPSDVSSFFLQRFPMKIENCHIRHQRSPQGHQRPPR